MKFENKRDERFWHKGFQEGIVTSTMIFGFLVIVAVIVYLITH